MVSIFISFDTVYGSYLKFLDIMKIQKLQNSYLRFIFGRRKHNSVTKCICCISWLNMQEWRKYNFACIIKNKIPLYEKVNFRQFVYYKNLKFKLKLLLLYKNILFKHSFSFVTFSIYIQLLDDLKTTNTSILARLKIFMIAMVLTIIYNL